jgi:hypothetical protein
MDECITSDAVRRKFFACHEEKFIQEPPFAVSALAVIKIYPLRDFNVRS